ncbi:MAG: MFS transporter [Planctomycetales bacterium]|nr:MFS transporter [Planctomycetales bacterium]
MTTNRTVLLWASFLTLIAAGVGFAIRGGVLAEWGTEFGFTQTELGTITGGGLIGFGFVIIFFSSFADQIGYKPLMILAFLLHVLSAIVTLAAGPVFESFGKDATYWTLYVGMFMFAVANGICETVINPLVATLYPTQKTHYLNILHAGWPGGLIVGGLLAFCFVGESPAITHLRWEIPMAFFLVPTLAYGFMFLKEAFPHSEAKAAGVSFGEMLQEFAAPLLLFLFVLHAMVGYVELGTDSWITNIMDNVFPNGILVLVYTSTLMFILRFFAGPIVERINPIGLLFVSAVLACIGLYGLGSNWATTFAPVIVAATIYGVGKTFFWPTMLGVVGERFPKGGALTMGFMGGIGMLSAGFLGGPGIGYQQDRFAAEELRATAPPEVYESFLSADKNRFLFFEPVAGLNAAKLGEIKELPADELTEDQKLVLAASTFGGRKALRYTAVVPFMMAIGYLILVIYFRAKGGYKVEVLHGKEPDGERYTGGVEGPVE